MSATLSQGRGDFTNLDIIRHHPAHQYLKHISVHGAPVVLTTEPWTTAQNDAAMERDLHKSTLDYQNFLQEEMADFVKKGFWMVLPSDKVKHVKNLRASPLLALYPRTNNGLAPSLTTPSGVSTRKPYTLLPPKRAGLTYNKIHTDTIKFNCPAMEKKIIQDFEKKHPYWKDDEGFQFAPHNKSYTVGKLLRGFFGEYDELLDQKLIRQQQECVGWNQNSNQNVTEDETNENPRKKTFSRDTTKEG
jgi:hypothetical protein